MTCMPGLLLRAGLHVPAAAMLSQVLRGVAQRLYAVGVLCVPCMCLQAGMSGLGVCSGLVASWPHDGSRLLTMMERMITQRNSS